MIGTTFLHYLIINLNLNPLNRVCEGVLYETESNRDGASEEKEKKIKKTAKRNLSNPSKNEFLIKHRRETGEGST